MLQVLFNYGIVIQLWCAVMNSDSKENTKTQVKTNTLNVREGTIALVVYHVILICDQLVIKNHQVLHPNSRCSPFSQGRFYHADVPNASIGGPTNFIF